VISEIGIVELPVPKSLAKFGDGLVRGSCLVARRLVLLILSFQSVLTFSAFLDFFDGAMAVLQIFQSNGDLARGVTGVFESGLSSNVVDNIAVVDKCAFMATNELENCRRPFAGNDGLLFGNVLNVGEP
jgi:hypothetical protein